MKLHFEMPFEIMDAPEEAPWPNEWKLKFTYDYYDGEITFNTVDSDDPNYQGIEWLEFLKLVDKEADGDFVNNLYALASSYIDLNADEAVDDYYSND